MRILSLFAVASFLAGLVFVSHAVAEPYLGLYLTGIPSSEHDIEADQTLAGVTTRYDAKDAKFSGSVVYGGLVGYRFLPFLAAEIDVYRLNPGLKAQTGTVTSPTAASATITTKSGDLDLTIIALQLVGSYGLLSNTQNPDGQLQLYGGAGLAIFLADVDSVGSSSFATNFRVRDTTTEVGPQVKGGGRWFLTKNLAAFIEGRWARTRLHVKDTGTNDAGTPLELKLESNVNLPLALFGLSWFFR